VSGATYRIDVEHQPDPGSTYQWVARIIRLSDDEQVASVWGRDSDGAIVNARSWLYAQNVKQDGRTLYVNDEGADEPQPVKA
jgi:hypothetical protein